MCLRFGVCQSQYELFDEYVGLVPERDGRGLGPLPQSQYIPFPSLLWLIIYFVVDIEIAWDLFESFRLLSSVPRALDLHLLWLRPPYSLLSPFISPFSSFSFSFSFSSFEGLPSSKTPSLYFLPFSLFLILFSTSSSFLFLSLFLSVFICLEFEQDELGLLNHEKLFPSPTCCGKLLPFVFQVPFPPSFSSIVIYSFSSNFFFILV